MQKGPRLALIWGYKSDTASALAYAVFHATRVLNDEIRSKLAKTKLTWLFLP